jgi:MYXO-CTERM domain-containing protein
MIQPDPEAPMRWFTTPKLPLSSLLVLGSALTLAGPLLLPTVASACGGTFCDVGPTTMPVDQTGENILFHIGPNSVEAHIQIQIDADTPADKFAWVIPVAALPEFEVGSQILFENLLDGSVPRYGLDTTSETCGPPDRDEGWGETGGVSTGDPNDGDGDPEGTPTVVFQASVGAFEIAVLDGGTVEGVMQWLGDNGYEQDPAAEPILAEYLGENFLFVALKLGVQSGVEDVHPIVIRYEGVEPCVPIRLTRIAAVDDMDIRTFFLGDARVVPTNYRHVLVNPLKLDWLDDASNYKEVITMAVDAPQAEGNAFVTEYAGPSNVISRARIHNTSWDAAAFAALGDSPVGLYDLLATQELMVCEFDWDNTCSTFHPLVQPLLDQYVPIPNGVEPIAFWECMECYADQIDLAAWDAAAFAAALGERIIEPGVRAIALLDANPYLTRMYTTISPHEMLADPMFRANPTLANVPASRIASRTDHCDGSTTVRLPDGREVYFPPGQPVVWPDFQDTMPWEEDVDQEGTAEGAPLINLVDNTDRINELLDEWNNARRGEASSAGEGGCGCSVGGDPLRGIALGLVALGLLGLVRRRRAA